MPCESQNLQGTQNTITLQSNNQITNRLKIRGVRDVRPRSCSGGRVRNALLYGVTVPTKWRVSGLLHSKSKHESSNNFWSKTPYGQPIADPGCRTIGLTSLYWRDRPKHSVAWGVTSWDFGWNTETRKFQSTFDWISLQPECPRPIWIADNCNRYVIVIINIFWALRKLRLMANDDVEIGVFLPPKMQTSFYDLNEYRELAHQNW